MKCSYCKSIVDKASNCPNCGAPLDAEIYDEYYDGFDEDTGDVCGGYDDVCDDRASKIKPLQIGNREEVGTVFIHRFTFYFLFAVILAIVGIVRLICSDWGHGFVALLLAVFFTFKHISKCTVELN